MTVTNFNTILKQDAYVRVSVCVCLSFQRVEVVKLLQHLLLTGLSYLPCQKHFIYNSVDLHQGEGKWTDKYMNEYNSILYVRT